MLQHPMFKGQRLQGNVEFFFVQQMSLCEEGLELGRFCSRQDSNPLFHNIKYLCSYVLHHVVWLLLELVGVHWMLQVATSFGGVGLYLVSWAL